MVRKILLTGWDVRDKAFNDNYRQGAGRVIVLLVALTDGWLNMTSH